MKKTILTITLIAITVVITGCGTDYDFKGTINKEEISCSFFRGYILEVTKEDGTKITYKTGRDKKVFEVKIEKDEKETWYTKDLSGTPVIEKAQEQLDYYLKLIIETKKNKGLEDLGEVVK